MPRRDAGKGPRETRPAGGLRDDLQKFNLVPRLDVVPNVLHGTLIRHSTLATMFNLFPMDETHHAIDILDRMGIAEHAPKRAEALLGGQQQRTAIARALCRIPGSFWWTKPSPRWTR